MDRQKSSSPLAVFPSSDGSRVPYKVFSDEQIYVLEQERMRLIPLSQVGQYLGLADRIRNGAGFDFFGGS
jgi:hypothetical protein